MTDQSATPTDDWRVTIHELPDGPFIAAWKSLSDAERSEVGTRGFDRYRKLTPWVNAGIERASALGRAALDNGNGHDHEPPEYYDEIQLSDPNPPNRKPLNWAALEGQEPPTRRWATDYWFGFGHVTLMVGQGGIGKTLCAQQWVSALSLGVPFIDASPAKLKCLMWACEDDHDELWRRQVAIAQWLKRPLSAFSDLVIEPRHGEENTLMTTEYGRPMFTPLLHELQQQAADYAAQVVVLDNVAQIYGGNENDRHSVTAFMNRLAGALPGKAIMLLAHPSRGQGSEYSGSSAWEAVARTRLYLGRNLPDQPEEGDQQETTRYLSRRKANYGARDYRRFEFNAGVLIQDATEGAGGIIESIQKGKAERVVMDGLQALSEKGIYGTDGKTSPRYLPRMLMDYKLAQGLTQRELGDAMRAATMAGKIVRGVVGRNDNRSPIYGMKATGVGAQT